MRSVKELSTLGEMYGWESTVKRCSYEEGVLKAEIQLHCLIKLLVKSLGYKVVEIFPGNLEKKRSRCQKWCVTFKM